MVGMSYGFFLSTICDTTADAMKMAISSFFPVLMVVSGYISMDCEVIWPLTEGVALHIILTNLLKMCPDDIWQVCGVIWPLEGMPNQWLQQIAWFLPQTASMQVDLVLSDNFI